jgi:Putative transposase
VRRFLLHVLPTATELKRIRHYGVLAASCKAAKLAQVRAALAMPAGDPMALEAAAAFL